MKNFYTLKEFNNLYKDQMTRSFEDHIGRNIAKALYISQYKIDPDKFLFSTGNLCWDLSFDKTAVEVKYRYFTSDRFSTHLVNIEKYYWMRKYIDEGKFDYAYLVSIWEDGVIWVSNMLDKNTKFEVHYQNKTTQVSSRTDGKKVPKECIVYEPEEKYNIVMHFIQNTGTELDGEWRPIIRKEKIDIEELEENWNNRLKERNLGIPKNK